MENLPYISRKNDILNIEQRKAYLELIKYINLIQFELKNEHEDIINMSIMYFLLNGPGGAGKTYLLCLIIEELKKTDLNFKILAPTHKACNVIKNDLVNCEVETVAKFLGFKEELNEKGESIITYTYFDKLNPKKENLLIIDECSMISKDQLEVLKKTKINILFVGDICQINPVGEEVSEVFDLDFFSRTELIKNERIKDPELGAIIIDYRESVLKNFLQKKCVSNKYRIQDRDEFNKKLTEYFKKDEDTVYIAYTNTQVLKYNNIIRESLFGKDALKYVKGETLICNTFCNSENSKFYTGEKLEVRSCHLKKLNVYNPKCVCKKTGKSEFMDTEEINIEQIKIEKCEKCKTPTSIFSHKTFEFWCLVFYDAPGEVFYKPVNGMKDLYPIIYKYRDRAKLTMNKMRWGQYYRMLTLLNFPVEYSYCITVHKSQGSGYKNVFVDIENITFCQKEKEKLKLYYTAISRCRENLFFIK
jgi:exodeoxyribonuclease-5